MNEKTRGARLTIGYLAPAIYGGSLDQWLGVVDAARKHDVNLLCFPGWSPNYPTGFQAQANVLYNLVTPQNVDGIITWASSIGNYMTAEEIQAFHDRYRPLPMVTIGRTLEGIPSLLMDSYEGMREAIVHLIEVHGRRRVVFIRGPESHFYAQERYRAYTETLEAYGIPFNPNLVTPPSTWGMDVGSAVTQMLLDERQLIPGKDFDAVAGANDEMVIGAWDVLQARGVHIPGDVAVVGFDNRLEGRTRTPPLTSVAGSFYEIGYQSVETLLAVMAGERVPEEATVPSRLVVRQSCGCLPPLVAQVVMEQRPVPRQIKGSQEELEAVLLTQREEILAKMMQAAGDLGGSLDSISAGQLLDGFAAELREEPQGAFLTALDEVLHQEVAVVSDVTERNVVALQSAVTAMRHSLLPCLSVEALAKAESLWQQARLVIAETTRRVDMRLIQQAAQQSQALREIGVSLMTAFDRKALADALVEALPTLGMTSAYLALYAQRSGLSGSEQSPYTYPDPAPEWSRLVLAYTENGQIALAADGMRFRSQQLVPQDLWPQGRPSSYVVNSLYFLENQIGFALLEVGPRDGEVYDILRGEMSSALQGNLLREQVRERAVQLQTAAEVSRVTSSILEPEVLIEQVVELVRERFDLYYVGLFLVEEASSGAKVEQSAVLQAGTGKTGRQMVAQGHRLAVGGKSMVGQCLQSGQARIALDVGENAVRFENPLLPHTRSELVLPLVSRGEAIGALTIQSTEEAAFSDGDVAVFQTMADQVANAIANTRLYDEARREYSLLQALLDNSPDYIFFKDRESRFIRTNKAHARSLLGISDPREVEGKTDFDLYPGEEENTQRFYDEEQWLMETGEPVIGREWKVPSQTVGEDVWLSEHKIPIQGETGEVVGLVGIGRDITSLKMAEMVLERRALQLQTAAEVSRAASSILDLDDLIRQVVGLIQERFNLYYTGLFLVDQAGKWAVLRAGTGESAQQMLARGHKLEVGGESMIGWCIVNKQARIALDVGEEAVRFENPLLPETRSELALPLVSRGAAIGALTIQSSEEAAFSDEDVAVLQTMADQVANAIENVRLFNRSQEALREMEATQRRYQRRAWSEYAQIAPVTSYETHRPNRAPLGDEVLPEIRAALAHSEPTVLRKPGAGATLVAPITQRGAAIGALGVHLDDTRRELTEDELALVQVVAERVGLVAETLRLLDETQRSAAQERLVGEVTSRIRESLDIETVLKTTASEIRQALDLETLDIRLATPEMNDESDLG